MAMIRHPKDFFAGLLFIAFGVAAIVIGSTYALGTAARMGPGYFPRILGILLIGLGAILALCALRLQGSPVPAFKWRPTVIVLGSVVLVGLIVEQIGLFVSTIGLIFVSSMASHEFRWKEALVSGIFFALLAVAALGFSVAMTPINLLYAFIGSLPGTLIGVLPGIEPVATIAILLPTTYALQPVSALIMLAGIYYGAQYGGSTTSILLNMPGEPSSAVTCHHCPEHTQEARRSISGGMR